MMHPQEIDLEDPREFWALMAVAHLLGPAHVDALRVQMHRQDDHRDQKSSK